MPFAWKPAPGQVALIELAGSDDGSCFTGIVIGDDTVGDAVVIDLGASPAPPGDNCAVVASFFAPDALYKVTATANPHAGRDKVIDLSVLGVERVQRRAAPRAKVSVATTLRGSGGVTSSGKTIDLGEGGCRVLLDAAFPSSDDPIVVLELAAGHTVEVKATIVQAQTGASGAYEYRLVFLDLATDTRRRLITAIKTLTPPAG